jgi:dTDP-4-dehydrorhamnose reductase
MSSSDRLLILGATGQLGHDLVLAAAAQNVEHVGLGHEDVEITSAESVVAAIRRVAPTVVINSAAFPKVDECEENPRQAYLVNALGALVVAQAAARAGARCVHVSTDYVFAGDKAPPLDGVLTPVTGYVESDPTGPLNVYGASKLAGEQGVALAGAEHVTVRVSSLFGVVDSRRKGGNFIETILKTAKAGGPLKVVHDPWITPTYTADAAPAIIRVALGGATGVVHVTNSGGCTWHALASEAVRLAALGASIEPISAADYYSKVRRPRNSALYTGRLASLTGAPLRSWRDALRAYLQAKGHLS